MRKATTTKKISEAIANNMLKIEKAEVYYKTSDKTETIDTAIFREDFSFFCESGIFMDCIGWHYERDYKSNGYICETGRMNPNIEIIVIVYLSVCDDANTEDIERILEIVEG